MTKGSLSEGKELKRNMEEVEIREMSESGGGEGGGQEEGEEDGEVESDDENELLELESLSAGLCDMAFAGLKKASTVYHIKCKGIKTTNQPKESINLLQILQP